LEIFFSTLCGDDLAAEFEMIDERDVAKSWKYFRLAFALSYSKPVETEDHTSEPVLLSQYYKSKDVELFEVPIEFKSDLPDDNPCQPISNSVVSKRKAAKLGLGAALRRTQSVRPPKNE